jgi:hypothetical protein
MLRNVDQPVLNPGHPNAKNTGHQKNQSCLLISVEINTFGPGLNTAGHNYA